MHNTIGPDLPEAPETALPPPLPPANAPESIPWGHWLRRLLASNPFYLLSAALLLFGIYRVSTEAGLFSTETAQLAFNFSALQIYELLLVATALLLARRAVWYDATLLAALENAFVLVPFMLVTQAALIEQAWVWGFCSVGVALALVRASTARTAWPSLNLPARALACGALILAVNAALPVIYRHLHESKYGTKLAAGAAYAFNEWTWLALLPVVILSGLLLPRARATGELWPQRRWLPAGFFLLWLIATVTHLYSLGYVYDFDLRRELIAPGAWALAWLLCRRITDLTPTPSLALSRALLIAPLFTPWVAGAFNHHTAFTLGALNVLLFLGAMHFSRFPHLSFGLAVTATLMAIAALPLEWGNLIMPAFNPFRVLAGLALVLLVLLGLISRDPKHGLLGASALAGAVAYQIHPESSAWHWAMQTGCVFLLLHSLRWKSDHEGTFKLARTLLACVWAGHACVWAHLADSDGILAAAGMFVLAVWFGARRCGWITGMMSVPLAASVVLFSGPTDAALRWLNAAPTGITALIGSLALFALGTAAALTKHRWHRAETTPDEPQL